MKPVGDEEKPQDDAKEFDAKVERVGEEEKPQEVEKESEVFEGFVGSRKAEECSHSSSIAALFYRPNRTSIS